MKQSVRGGWVLPLLVLTLTLGGTARAETLASAAGGDKPAAQLTAMLSGLQLVSDDKLTATVRQLRFLEQQYKVDPFLLVAVMEREQQWGMAAKGHQFAFNLKHGFQDFTGSASLPNPFNDMDTCAYALQLQKQEFGQDVNAIVAAYFAGPTKVKEWKGEYPDEIKELLNNVWAMVKTYKAPLKGKGAPAQPQAAPQGRGALPGRGAGASGRPIPTGDYGQAIKESYRSNATPPDAVEQAYIDVMRYFNRRIREDVAREIYRSIAHYAAQYEGVVDARLVMALVATESNFNPHAVSPAGAEGLGQLMPFTADSLNVSNSFDIEQNIRGTFAYLDREFKRWGGHPDVLDRVLAAYNAGPGAVQKYNGIPPYKETQNYVRRVVNIYCAILQPHEREAHLKGHTRYDDQLLYGRD